MKVDQNVKKCFRKYSLKYFYGNKIFSLFLKEALKNIFLKMSKCKKHLAPTPLNVDFSLREPSKKIIGFFFLKKIVGKNMVKNGLKCI